jgi:biopolymer transport protein TolR
MMVPGGKNGSGNHTTLAEINVTPFVDVMLVLLIVFMVSAPLMQQGLEINLPKAEEATLEEGPDPIVLTVTAAQTIRSTGRP